MTDDRNRSNGSARSEGSALVLAIFVLTLLATMGVTLLTLSQSELTMSKAGIQTKAAFFLAEAGVEGGRAALLQTGGTVDLDTKLTAAAGPDGEFSFDAGAIRPVYDAAGTVVDFAGYGDDVPVHGPMALGDGMFVAFLTNDPVDAEGADPLVDTNERVMITGVGSLHGGTLEIVRAIVEPEQLLPSVPPCTIMMLGPDPDFAGGDGSCDDEGSDSPDKTFSGTDCDGSGGIAGHFVPVVCVGGCTPGGSGDEVVEMVLTDPCPNEYVSGTFSGADTIADLHDPYGEPTMGAGFEIDPDWLDCEALTRTVERAREIADFICLAGSCTMTDAAGWAGGAAPSTSASSITFVDGDLTIGPSVTGSGMLWVTGTLRVDASASWSGPFLVIGKGEFLRTGTTGDGPLSGATVVVNVAGDDALYGTGDDCQGGEGGLRTATYHEAVDEVGDTTYCTDDLSPADPFWTFEVTQFRQF